jgi:RNA polymerase sigma-70 factor (ECF subfamily)
VTGSRQPAGGDQTEDAALLERHVQGDPDAFTELVARHRDRLWAVALRTLGDPDDAADAVQDGLLRAFRRAETFRGEAAVTTWLHRVVVNACLDQMRRRRARPSDPVDPQEDSALDSADRAVSPDDGDPEAAALAAERRARVLAALATLPADQRAALVLVDMQGWSVNDAAAALDCPEGTVKSRCSRGRARLAPLLAEFSSGAAVTQPTDEIRNQVAARRVSSAGREAPVADDHKTTGRAT